MDGVPHTNSRPAAAVLVVDDDRDMVVLIGRIVERMGHRHVAAGSGEEALSELALGRFDLIITDINMSGLSGLELLEAARSCDEDVAVVVVSGVDDPRTAEIALGAGAFGYVVKPFEITELQIAVSNALRRRELEIGLRQHLNDLEAQVDGRTEQFRLASELAQTQERRFRSLAQASPLGIVYADKTGEFDYCNSNAEALLGRGPEQLAGKRWLTELDSAGRDALAESVREAAPGVSDAMCDYELRRPNGSTVWIRSRVAPVLDDDDRSAGVVVLFEDIGDRKRLENQLRHQASHDHLTGLPNRREFRTQLAHRLISLEPPLSLGVLLVDLDQFKLVNDTYGHDAGDQLIVTVGERLVGCVPEGTLVARLGGDEYVVAVVSPDREGIVAAAETIRHTLRQPMRIMGVELSLSASIGIGLTSDPQAEVSGLLRSADIAMHSAKNRRDVVEVFNTSMAKDVARRLALTSELRRVIENDLLGINYQPVVDTVSQRLVGFEALARWTHDKWGQVGPNEFIPIAESMGLVHRVDAQILTAAVNQLAQWRATGRVHPDVFMSVNLSASQLSNSALPELVHRALDRAGVPGTSLRIEVTESSLISDVGRAVPIMCQLRELGIRIAVDDFGTGHSALSYLGQLPLDMLKIDRSFVAAIGMARLDVAEVIIDLAHRFGLEVIAEGVEEPHQLARLRALGCDMVQGFLTGRPADADHALSDPATMSSGASRTHTETTSAAHAALNEIPA